MNNNIFYYELSIKLNVYIIFITVSTQKQYNLEPILTSNDSLDIKYVIGKVFGYIERSYCIRVNDYFGPIITNIPHGTSRYGPG